MSNAGGRKTPTLTRRELLLAIAASQLAGYACVSRPKPICPFDPEYQNPDSLLTIDVHAHVFNATDLQVKEFINRVAVGQSGGVGALAKFFGGVLQSIAWSAAPTTEQEASVLGRLKPDIVGCDSDHHVATLKDLREEKFAAAKRELQDEAARRLPAGLSRASLSSAEPQEVDDESAGMRQIFELPDSYEELAADRPQDPTSLSTEELREVTLKSGLRFVIEMFQYRFVSVYNYLGDYSAGADQKVDLLAAALVDYDFWLSKGAPTPSTLPAQMALMREISILSGGRVHALVPFDPFRQVVFDLAGESHFSPLDLVRTGIEQQGAVGVKLYPPMGFAPLGNTGLDVWRGKNWLSAVARRADFAERLDTSMNKLFEYCARASVPVMGHSNHSNGPADDFEALTGPQYWQRAAAAHPDVSLSFGHFGGAGSDGGDADVRGFLDLMVADFTSGNQRLQADASYFAKLLDDPAQLERVLEEVFRYGPGDSRVAIDRLMYGSDWKMLAAENHSDTYLGGFADIIRKIESQAGADTQLASKFFGRNAARFFGLTRGGENRRRLERFYDEHDMREPLWMTKVDET